MTISYDGAGNIVTKSNVEGGATYTYGGSCNGVTAGPHAVTGVGSLSYCYDANGNQLSGDGRNIAYTTYKPSQISKGAHTTYFEYGPNRSRYERIDSDSGNTTTTLYLGNVERITKPDGTVETKRYIDDKEIVTTTTGGANPVELILLTDHLGSTYALVNRVTGYVLNQGMSFDAFGLRRSTSWGDFTTTQLETFDTSNTHRGYTGHEQLDEVGLIHMNGRIYDPKLGRFLEADPTVQAPNDTQSYNRYAYVRNNRCRIPTRRATPFGKPFRVSSNTTLAAGSVSSWTWWRYIRN